MLAEPYFCLSGLVLNRGSLSRERLLPHVHAWPIHALPSEQGPDGKLPAFSAIFASAMIRHMVRLRTASRPAIHRHPPPRDDKGGQNNQCQYQLSCFVHFALPGFEALPPADHEWNLQETNSPQAARQTKLSQESNKKNPSCTTGAFGWRRTAIERHVGDIYRGNLKERTSSARGASLTDALWRDPARWRHGLESAFGQRLFVARGPAGFAINLQT
jgi:hypothetical protein